MSSKLQQSEVCVKTEPEWDKDTSEEETRLISMEYEDINTDIAVIKEEPQIKIEVEGNSARESSVASHHNDTVTNSNMVRTESVFASEVLQVKKEEYEDIDTEWDATSEVDVHGVSESAARAGLYTDHVVDGELVVGPEGVQPVCRVPGDESEENALLKIRERTDTERVACDICNKTFKTKNNLKVHARIHTGEKPYSCVKCKQKFLRLGDLKKHDLIHTDEKALVCDICHQGFRHLGDLKRHELVHTGDKPYSCGLCGKTFTRLGDLQAHKRIHAGEKPYFCKICNMKFTQSGTLRKHERTHTGEMPYSCAVCGRRFKVKYSLTVHEGIHTGEKPYTCGICEKKFVSRSGLTRHERTHAGLRRNKDRLK